MRIVIMCRIEAPWRIRGPWDADWTLGPNMDADWALGLRALEGPLAPFAGAKTPKIAGIER